MACSTPAEAFEIRDVTMVPFPSTTSTIETRLVKPSPSEFVLSRIPSLVHADRPLELEVAAVELSEGADAAESVASWISAHAVLQMSVEVPGQPRGEVSVLVTARPSGGGWTARALVRPAAWANATSVTVLSLSLAGQPLPGDFLPVTLRVGYNHSPAPAGAVFAAAKAGDEAALDAAIEAGGSTEEADTVRGGMRMNHEGLNWEREERAATLLPPSSHWGAGRACIHPSTPLPSFPRHPNSPLPLAAAVRLDWR